MSIWSTLILQPLINLLVFTYQALGSNLGFAIISVTVMIRLSLIPLTSPGMKSAQKMQEIKPELDKLKEKYGKDKQGLAQAQLELYKKEGINPAGGILPMILQFVVLIGLFQSLNIILKSTVTVEELNQYLYSFLQLKAGFFFNPNFFFWNLTTPDTIALAKPISLLGFSITAVPGVLLTSSAIVQFLSSKFMMAKPKKAIKKKTDEPDMASMMQKQMLFMMPIMTLLIGFRFQAGLVIYWLTFSAIMVVQQVMLKKNPETNK